MIIENEKLITDIANSIINNYTEWNSQYDDDIILLSNDIKSTYIKFDKVTGYFTINSVIVSRCLNCFLTKAVQIYTDKNEQIKIDYLIKRWDVTNNGL